MSVIDPSAVGADLPASLLPDDDEIAAVAAEAADLGLTAAWGPVRRVRLGGGPGALSALAWGAAPARVVALHGAGLNAHTWDGTLARWGVPALAVDLPGHGLSPWRTDADYGPAVVAPAVLAALRDAQADGLLAERPVVVGQSLGGLTALALLAAGLPAAHVVLVDVLPLPPQAGAQVAAFLAGPTTFSSREEVVARALAFGLGGARSRLERAVRLNTWVGPDCAVRWRHHLGELAAAGHLALTIEAEAGWEALRSTDVPVDLVRGARGIVGAPLTDRLATERPSVRVVTLDGGHNLQEDAPVALADALAGLVRLPARGPVL